VQQPSRLCQRELLEAALVEEIPEIGCDVIVGSFDGLDGSVTETLQESRRHAGEDLLGLECLTRILQYAVERAESSKERGILDVGIVDGSADQAFVEDLGVHVEHPLAEPGAGGGPPVVYHVRGKDRHPGSGGAAVLRLEVVPDRALVDDEHRPRVVGVRRVDVIDEPRVEDLVDAGNGRLPCSDPLAGHGQDAGIVQDLLKTSAFDDVVNELPALVGFAFVGTVSPGPNNTVLWASGMRFGFRRTLPHVVGTALGIGMLSLGVAAGIGALLDAIPAAELALKVVGTAYLLYLAFLVSRHGGVGRADVSHPLSLGQGITFQCVNPKAWIFVIAAVGTFLSPALPRLVGVGLLTGTLMIVAVGSSSIWAAGGAALGRVVENERTRRVVSIALALLLVASAALIWV
jgi:threonine/homoserine/homoserine lactone efflux protein